MGINFGDLKPIEEINVMEPVAKAAAISSKAINEGLLHIEQSAKEEAGAMKLIAEEMYKSGKVDFAGNDAKYFKEAYNGHKQKLINELKKYGSVQAFLNNGGYEKIAEFKQGLDNDPTYHRGVQNKLMKTLIEEYMKKGLPESEMDFGIDANGNPNSYSNFINGKSDIIDFKGVYNQTLLKLDSFAVHGKNKENTLFSDEDLRLTMKQAHYSDTQIEKAIQLNRNMLKETGGKLGFIAQLGDPNYGIREAQIQKDKEIAAATRASKEAMNTANNETKKQIADLKASNRAYELQLQGAEKDDAKKWESFKGMGKPTNIAGKTYNVIKVSDFDEPQKLGLFDTEYFKKNKRGQENSVGESAYRKDSNKYERVRFLTSGKYINPEGKEIDVNSYEYEVDPQNSFFDPEGYKWHIAVQKLDEDGDPIGEKQIISQNSTTMKNAGARSNVMTSYRKDKKYWQSVTPANNIDSNKKVREEPK